MMSVAVISWWALLCAIALFNIGAWCVSARALPRHQAGLSSEIYTTRRWQLVLSGIYVFGCAFRSIFPVYDVPRICMFDSWLSSVVVGRSIATIAELSFVAQWALMLREISRATDNAVGKAVSLLIVPLIAIAEICSWYSVLTTANIGHVVEESIWALSVAIMIVNIVILRPRCIGKLRYVLDACCVAGIAYVAFMVLVDVPMYWNRWIADQANGRQYLSVVQGFADVASLSTVSHRWEDWHREMPWMTLYFSVAVWFSIALAHVPTPRLRDVATERKRLRSAVA